MLCMDDHDLEVIFGPRPIHRLPFQNSTLQIGTCVSICMYVYKKKEMKCMDDHDLHAIFGTRPIHRLPFQNTTPPIGTCVSICMYA